MSTKTCWNNKVSPNYHVVMNHQNQTRTNGIWGHVRYTAFPWALRLLFLGEHRSGTLQQRCGIGAVMMAIYTDHVRISLVAIIFTNELQWVNVDMRKLSVLNLFLLYLWGLDDYLFFFANLMIILFDWSLPRCKVLWHIEHCNCK
jgi:Na+/H+ antiporter NhaA